VDPYCLTVDFVYVFFIAIAFKTFFFIVIRYEIETSH
jgi:hypothetical protein